MITTGFEDNKTTATSKTFSHYEPSGTALSFKYKVSRPRATIIPTISIKKLKDIAHEHDIALIIRFASYGEIEKMNYKGLNCPDKVTSYKDDPYFKTGEPDEKI